MHEAAGTDGPVRKDPVDITKRMHDLLVYFFRFPVIGIEEGNNMIHTPSQLKMGMHWGVQFKLATNLIIFQTPANPQIRGCGDSRNLLFLRASCAYNFVPVISV
jgi:hypothetical protein